MAFPLNIADHGATYTTIYLPRPKDPWQLIDRLSERKFVVAS